MIDEIKQRIEQIKAGRTPEGYRRTKAGIMPDDWKVVRLGDLGEFKKGKNISSADLTDDGLPCIMYGDIYVKYDTFFTKTDFKISPETAKKSTKVSKNDLLFTSSGETADEIGKCVSYQGEEDIYIGGDIIALTPKGTNSLFLAYQQNGYYQIKQKAEFGQGYSVVHIYPEQIKSLLVLLPSISEQEKIVRILLTWDKAIKLKERLIEEKKRRKKWLIQKLLNPESGVRLPGFKDDWDFVKLNEVVGLSTEKYNPIISDIDYICIELEHIEPFSGRLIGYTSSKRQKSIKNVFHKGQVLFGKLRPYLRKYLKPEFDGVCSTEIWVFDCKTKRIIGDFLFYLVQSDNFINNANLSSGSKMPRADWDHVRNITIPLPSIPEQTAIAQILSTADREIELLEKELEETKLQKKALMQLLLTGIVRVNDQLAMSN